MFSPGKGAQEAAYKQQPSVCNLWISSTNDLITASCIRFCVIQAEMAEYNKSRHLKPFSVLHIWVYMSFSLYQFWTVLFDNKIQTSRKLQYFTLQIHLFSQTL